MYGEFNPDGGYRGLRATLFRKEKIRNTFMNLLYSPVGFTQGKGKISPGQTKDQYKPVTSLNEISSLSNLESNLIGMVPQYNS